MQNFPSVLKNDFKKKKKKDTPLIQDAQATSSNVFLTCAYNYKNTPFKNHQQG